MCVTAYNDCANEVDAGKVGLAQVGGASTQCLLGNMVVMKPMAKVGMFMIKLMGGVAARCDFFVVLFFCHGGCVSGGFSGTVA